MAFKPALRMKFFRIVIVLLLVLPTGAGPLFSAEDETPLSASVVPLIASPHGGTMVSLGKKAPWVEIVLDSDFGDMILYVLDRDAKTPLRIEQRAIHLYFFLKGPQENPDLAVLQPVEDTQTGETLGNASVFRGGALALIGEKRFTAVLGNMSVGGKDYEPVQFLFPQGNQADFEN